MCERFITLSAPHFNVLFYCITDKSELLFMLGARWGIRASTKCPVPTVKYGGESMTLRVLGSYKYQSILVQNVHQFLTVFYCLYTLQFHINGGKQV